MSPGKTVEGLRRAAWWAASLGALAVRAGGLPELPLGHAVALGLVVAALGTAGDLSRAC